MQSCAQSKASSWSRLNSRRKTAQILKHRKVKEKTFFFRSDFYALKMINNSKKPVTTARIGSKDEQSVKLL